MNKISLPKQSAVPRDHPNDAIANELLVMYCGQAVASTTSAKRVTGDGNCLFRAASLGMFGTEVHHLHLRLLTLLEIIENPNTYIENKKECIIQDNRIIMTEYKKLCRKTATIGVFSEMAHLYALSTVLGQPIFSFYPTPFIECEVSEAHRRKVVGRGVKNKTASLSFMWSSASKPKAPKKFKPNHFVLLTKESQSTQTVADVVNLITSPVYLPSHQDDFSTNDTYLNIDESSCLPSLDLGEEHEKTPNRHELKRNAQSSNTFTISDHQSENVSKPHGTLSGAFLSVDSLVQAMQTQEPLENIPRGTCENVFFVIESSDRQTTHDDCGPWVFKNGTTSYYISDGNGGWKSIIQRNGIYYSEKQVKTQSKRLKCELEQQPSGDDILILRRHYYFSKSSQQYQRRVTTFNHVPPSCRQLKDVLIVEYLQPHQAITSRLNSEVSSDKFAPKLFSTPMTSSTSTHDASHSQIQISGELTGSFLELEDVVAATRTEKTFRNAPPGIKQNVFFVLDTSDHATKSEATFDDCGAWENNCNPTSYFLIEESGKLKNIKKIKDTFFYEHREDGKTIKTELSPQPDECDLLIVDRYYSYQSSKTFRRRITTFKNIPSVLQNYIVANRCVVEYLGKFPGYIRHGNAKHHNVHYCRTNPETLKRIDDGLKDHIRPHKIFQKLNNQDNSMMAPRDRKQIQNRKHTMEKKQIGGPQQHRKNIADDMQTVFSMLNVHPYVKCVNSSSGRSLNIVLYDEDGMSDLLNILQIHPNTVLGIDRTFNLGHCYVTTTTFKHPALVRKSSQQHPIFQGPIFIHSNADTETYYQFFSHLHIKFQSIKTFVGGTDDEKAITSSMRSAFGDKVIMVRCTNHLKQNIKEYLDKKSKLIPEQRKKVYSKFIELLGTDDNAEFRHTVSEIAQLLEETGDKNTEEYFINRVIPAVLQFVMQPVWKGIIQRNWTNNNAESHNNVLKHQTEWRLLKIPELIKEIHTIHITQYQMLRKALYDTGEFVLSNEYKRFLIPRHKWSLKTDAEKNDAVSKFLRTKKASLRGTTTSTDGLLTVPSTPSNAGKKPHQRKRMKAAKTTSYK